MELKRIERAYSEIYEDTNEIAFFVEPEDSWDEIEIARVPLEEGEDWDAEEVAHEKGYILDGEEQCTWCGEIWCDSEIVEEKNLGCLCPRCVAAIESRGERLTIILR